MRLFFLGFVLTLSACDMAHLGNPVMWPAMVVGNAAQNASYNARRTRVEAHVNAHHGDILNEIENGGGPALSQGMNLARVPKQTRPEVLRILKKDIAKFSPDTDQAREMLVVWLMMHGR
jgi:hypothetical protein